MIINIYIKKVLNNNMITRGNKYTHSKQRIIFYDFETTGFNPYHNQIIEIGACDNFGNIFNLFMKADKPLSQRIVEITKITDSLLSKEGVSQKEGLQQFYSYINNDLFTGNTYLVAHNNYAFDSQFLKFQSLKYNIDTQNTDFIHVDTLKIAQYVMPDMRSHSMGTLSKYFNIKNENEHRAYSDAITLQKIYKRLQNIFIRKYSIDDIDKINNMVNKPFVNNITKQKCKDIDTQKSKLHKNLRRCHTDIKDLTEKNINFKYFRNKNHIQLICLIHGSDKSPYEGKQFYVDLKLNHQWPETPPSIRFVTRILHPNVDYNSGHIILPLFNSKEYNSKITILNTLDKLESILSTSYLTSIYKTDKVLSTTQLIGYCENAKECAQIHGIS